MVKSAKVKATNYKACLALEVPAYVAFYKSPADFLGNDVLTIEVKFAGGRTEIQKITVNVMASAHGRRSNRGGSIGCAPLTGRSLLRDGCRQLRAANLGQASVEKSVNIEDRLTLGLIFALLTSSLFDLGAGMRAALFKSVLTAASLGFTTSGTMLPAGAADLGLMTSGPGAIGNCSEIVFTCENGRQYPLCPIAVSVVGEVVTASLHTGHRGGIHVRLVPMGVGYR